MAGSAGIMSSLLPVAWTVARWLRKVAIVVLLLLFTLVSVASLALFAIGNTLTDRNTYHNLIQQTQLAQRIPAAAPEQLMLTGLRAGGLEGVYLASLTSHAWESAADQLLPESWLEENLHRLVDALFDWLRDSHAAVPEFTLDLAPLIQILNSPRGVLIILSLLQNTPACPPDVIEIIILDRELVSCLPEESELTSLAQRVATGMASGLPLELSLASLDEVGLIPLEALQLMERVRLIPQLFETTLALGLRLTLLCLLLYGLFYTASLQQFLKALPLPFYLAGTFSLITIGALYLFQQVGLAPVLSLTLPARQPELSLLLKDVVRTLIGDIVRDWLYGSLLLLAGGLLVQVLTFSLDKYAARRQQPRETPARSRQRVRRQFRQ